jgi:hypothetical protein
MLIASTWLIYSALLLFLYVIARYISHRHTMPIVALAVPWVGYGVIRIAEGIQWIVARLVRPAAKVSSRWALCIVLVAVGGALARRSLRPLHQTHLPVVEAAVWVRAHARPGDAVLSNSNYVPFYADMPGRVLKRREALSAAEDAEGDLPYRFIVLDLESPTLNPDWLSAADSGYMQVEAQRAQDERRRVLVLEAVDE